MNPLDEIHSVMEVPIMDDKKWAKIPDIPADAFFIDLEDSAPLNQKDEARARAVDLIRDPSHLGGRMIIPRVNNLETDWGHADLVAMANAGAKVVTYPKVRTAGELETAKEILHHHGSDPYMCAVVESAKGVVNISDIARVDSLCGFFFGPSDLSLDAGFELYDESGMVSGVLDSARNQIALAGAANNVRCFDALFVRDMRSTEQVQISVERSRRAGYSGVLTFYPPHIPVINDVFRPDEDRVNRARQVVEVYEEAMGQGKTAVLLDGEALIIQDYKRALATLGRPF